MKKITAMLVAIAMSAMLVPSASAEVVVGTYTGSIGGGAEGVASNSLIACPAGCDLDEDGNDDVDAIGGRDLQTSGATYSNVVGSINDDVYGNEAAMSLCFYHPDGDFICDEDDFGSDAGCGGASLTGAPFAGDFVTFFLYTAYVTSDLDVCGATAGTMTATFF